MHHPEWFKITLPHNKIFYSVGALIKKNSLYTVCEEAKCPNRVKCYTEKRITFLILGRVCTRNCAYCGVAKGIPGEVDAKEPTRIAGLVKTLDLNYVVVTSVTRDDLADHGAGHFAAVVTEIKKVKPGCKIEVLTPDFSGNADHLEKVLASGPYVFAHNIEVVKELYPQLRPGGRYALSLRLLAQAKRMKAITKSGIMLGLGETVKQVYAAFQDLKKAGVDVLTVGQYLPPQKDSPGVSKYYSPGEFESLKTRALKMGFHSVYAGPLVRSSLHPVGVL